MSLWDDFIFNLLMTFMCNYVRKECENVSHCSFESPVFFGQQTMCHGFQTVSEVGRLGVNSKIPRNNTLNERLPFILLGMVGSSSLQSQLQHGPCWCKNLYILHLPPVLTMHQLFISPETGNAFEDLRLVLVNHMWGDMGIFWLTDQRAFWSSH